MTTEETEFDTVVSAELDRWESLIEELRLR